MTGILNPPRRNGNHPDVLRPTIIEFHTPCPGVLSAVWVSRLGFLVSFRDFFCALFAALRLAPSFVFPCSFAISLFFRCWIFVSPFLAVAILASSRPDQPGRGLHILRKSGRGR